MEKDPVCGMRLNPDEAAAQRVYQGATFHFCSHGCAVKFDQSPQRYVAAEPRRTSHPTSGEV